MVMLLLVVFCNENEETNNFMFQIHPKSNIKNRL